MSFSGLLVHSCNIQTVTETKTATGALTKNWANRETSIACRFQPLPTTAALTYGTLGLDVSHLVFFDTDYSLTVKDRLVFDSSSYEVKQVTPVYAGTSAVHHWEVMALLRAN